MAATIQYQAADLILQGLGAPLTAVGVNLLVAWMQQEYTADELAVTNNPLATSLQAVGVGGYCTLPNGEQASEPCYDTLAHGAAACAATIGNGLYPQLLQGLRGGDAASFFSQAGIYQLAVWAGGPGSPNYSYAQRIQATYGVLPPPPAWAMAPGGGAPGEGSVVVVSNPSRWPWIFGAGLFLGGFGLALARRR